MNKTALLHLLPLFVMLAIAAATDLHSRKIRNWLTFSLVLTGLAQSFTAVHTVGPAASFLGFGAGFGLTFLLFAMGALGGGDVKLLAGVGAWVGPMPVLAVFCLAAVAGMIIVLAQAVWQGRLRQLLHNSALVAVNIAHVNEVGMAHATATGKSCRSVDRPLPYAVPVFLGVAALVATSWLGHGIGG
ncbi:MAG: peptidase prepilin type [Phycisphaerales bacterium]|jgi:prepilin peptidase CpaA|nr:peptidase prepilin type [Phycisphaerales bacterium]